MSVREQYHVTVDVEMRAVGPLAVGEDERGDIIQASRTRYPSGSKGRPQTATAHSPRPTSSSPGIITIGGTSPRMAGTSWNARHWNHHPTGCTKPLANGRSQASPYSMLACVVCMACVSSTTCPNTRRNHESHHCLTNHHGGFSGRILRRTYAGERPY